MSQEHCGTCAHYRPFHPTPGSPAEGGWCRRDGQDTREDGWCELWAALRGEGDEK